MAFLRKRCGVAFCVLALALLTTGCGARIRQIDFWKNLDKQVLDVDGTAYTLRELAFYVAYEESIVEEQAVLYDREHPLRYWNVHTNGEFIRVRARTEAMNMAVHDIIFYDLAMDYALTLTEDEKSHALSVYQDFWDDLSDAQREKMQAVYEDMRECVLHMTLAQKYQDIYAITYDFDVETLDAEGEVYQEMLSDHTVKIRDDIWKGIGFGTVTIIR